IPDESRLYSAILLKLCKKFRPGAPPQEKLLLVLDALSKIEIRILALDEVNFTEAGTVAKQKHFLNALRYLANELRISIVCLGTAKTAVPVPQQVAADPPPRRHQKPDGKRVAFVEADDTDDGYVINGTADWIGQRSRSDPSAGWSPANGRSGVPSSEGRPASPC